MGAEAAARQGKETPMEALDALAAELGEALKAAGQTVAVAESSSGGPISAALLGVPGASKSYLGGAVVYTGKARMVLMDLPREAVAGMRSSSEPYALLLASTARAGSGPTGGVSEAGAAGPTANGSGEASGRTCIAISGPVETAITLETGES